MSDQERLSRLLLELRKAHPDMVHLFRNGGCYQLWKIVRTVFPEAECLYSQIEGHVYIGLDGALFDIEGRHLHRPRDLAPLDHRISHAPHRWISQLQRARLFQEGDTP